MYRVAGSVQSLLTIMRTSFDNQSGAIDLHPQLPRLELSGGKVDDGEADAELQAASCGDMAQVLGGELGLAATEAAEAAKTVEELPEEPPPDMKITIDDEDGAGRATVADEDAAAEDEDGDGAYVDREEEDDIEGDPNAPEPMTMAREITHSVRGISHSVSRARAASRARAPSRGPRKSTEITSMNPTCTEGVVVDNV